MPNKKNRERTDKLLTEEVQKRKKSFEIIFDELKEEIKKFKLKKNVA